MSSSRPLSCGSHIWLRLARISISQFSPRVAIFCTLLLRRCSISDLAPSPGEWDSVDRRAEDSRLIRHRKLCVHCGAVEYIGRRLPGCARNWAVSGLSRMATLWSLKTGIYRGAVVDGWQVPFQNHRVAIARNTTVSDIRNFGSTITAASKWLPHRQAPDTAWSSDAILTFVSVAPAMRRLLPYPAIRLAPLRHIVLHAADSSEMARRIAWFAERERLHPEVR